MQAKTLMQALLKIINRRHIAYFVYKQSCLRSHIYSLDILTELFSKQELNVKTEFKTLDFESEHGESALAFAHSMFKLGEFMKSVKNAFETQGLDELGKALSNRGGVPTLKEDKLLWFKSGVNCEILKPNTKGWQKGKIKLKITVEFCPDQPEVEETLASDKFETNFSNSSLEPFRS